MIFFIILLGSFAHVHMKCPSIKLVKVSNGPIRFHQMTYITLVGSMGLKSINSKCKLVFVEV
jgi:hypothetical protein